jgi:hypothetical protein
MYKHTPVTIDVVRGFELVSDAMQVGELNVFLDAGYEAYFVKMDGEKYSKAFGIDKAGNIFRAMG